MDHSPRWTMLDTLAAERGYVLPAEMYAELAERLREAIGDHDPVSVGALATQLRDLVGAAFASAAPQAIAAARGCGVDEAGPSAQAFALGQLGFAHLVAALAAEKRADAEFETLLAKEPFNHYLRALYGRDLTGTELAKAVHHRPETVSRNLKKLREIGAVSFRREGTNLVNFLTPAARHLVGEHEGPMLRTNFAPAVRERLRDEQHDLRQIMREVQTFAPEVCARAVAPEADLAET